jgi:hypothetical protein
MEIEGDSSRLSLTTAGLSTRAEFGAVSAIGVGVPEFEVSHVGAGPVALIAVQPGGSIGGVTLSKFSENSGVEVPITITEAEAQPEPLLLSVMKHA